MEAFWRLLRDGVDTITEVPPDRFDIEALYDPHPGRRGRISTRYGGFLAGIDGFDNAFFGVSPREALRMDPQQRLLLEVAWEALEDAGQVLDPRHGCPASVFIGVLSSDYDERIGADPTLLDAHATTGCSRSSLAGRLSYTLGLHGPSIVVDSACSSSLTAVHLACQSLRSGESALALAGGVNLILRPFYSISFSQGDMLAADGRCKFGDAAADGFVRSEGVGVLVLKRLSDALAAGDSIRAVIRGSALNSDGGRSGNLMTPSRASQEALLRDAYRSAGVPPCDVSYVEVHGTGTRVGDPVEIEALAAVLGEHRPAGRPCLVGTAKTNIGHAEAAAGIAGLVKAVLCLEHQEVPASLHVRTPNPDIHWASLPIKLQTLRGPLPQHSERAVAGVSSFGLSGANAHVVLESAPAPHPPTETAPQGAAFLLPISARAPQALKQLAGAYRDMLTRDTVPIALRDVAFTASLRRAHHEHRLALVGSSRAQIVEGLDRFIASEEHPGVSSGAAASEAARRLVFVFSGQGSQWLGMGCELLGREPVFRAVIEQCDAALRNHVAWSLVDELTASPERYRIDTIDFVQPALFSVQVALAALWRSWGVEPAAVVGHSMGEPAAAFVAGALSLSDAARIIAERSQLMRRVNGLGTMMVVGLPLLEAGEAIRGLEDCVSVAVNNNPGSTVLSGDTATLEDLARKLTAREIFCRFIKVDVAGHSPQLDPLLPEMRQAMSGVVPRAAEVPFYSAVLGARIDGRTLDTEYWVRNVRSPVLFWQAIEALRRDGHDTFLELNAHPIVLTSIQQGLHGLGAQATLLPSLRRDQGEREVMLRSLGSLYTRGLSPAWERLHAERANVVRLPPYPWQHQRFWPAPPSSEQAASTAPRHRLVRPGHALLARRVSPANDPGTHYWEADLSLASHPWLADHRIQGDIVLPGAAYLEMALSSGRELLPEEPLRLRDVQFAAPLLLSEEGTHTVQLAMTRHPSGELTFTISGAAQQATADITWMQHVTGRLSPASGVHAAQLSSPSRDALSRGTHVSRDEHDRVARALGLDLGTSFQAVEEVWRAQGEASARICAPPALQRAAESLLAHPALLDACFQGALHVLPQGAGDLYLLAGIDTLTAVSPLGAEAWSHIAVRPSPGGDEGMLEGDLVVRDGHGDIALHAAGLRFRRLPGSAPRRATSHGGLTRDALLAVGSEERQHRLSAYLVTRLSRVLGCPEAQIDTTQPMVRLGLDSLMAVELRNRVRLDLGLDLPLVKLLQGATLSQMATLIDDRVVATGATTFTPELPLLSPLVHRPVPPGTPQPLSFGQRALWFVHQTDPRSAAYNYGLAARLRGNVTPEGLRSAFQELLDRHDALRATFSVEDDVPVQRFHEHVDLDFTPVDATGDDDEALRTRVAAAWHAPFDLGAAPPVRVKLFSRSPGDSVLSLTFHHIVIDFWSLLDLLDELSTLLSGGTLAPPAFQYADFVRWQAELLTGAEEERLWTYWSRRLAGDLTPLALPTDFPRPPVQTYEGGSVFHALHPDLTRSLRMLASRHGATLHTTLLASFQVLLHRYTGQQRIIVGSVASGRSRTEFSSISGDFVNPIAIDGDLSGDPTFLAYLERAQAVALGALDHQDYPFARLVERLRPPRDPSRSPIFQVAFVLQQPHRARASVPFMQGQPGGTLQLGDLTLESFPFEQRAARFDLDLMAVEADDALTLFLQYNAHLFERATVERLLGHLTVLLEGIVADPAQPLSELPLLGEAERHRVLVSWNDTRVAPLPVITVHGLVEAQVTQTPHAVAAAFGDDQVTYRELDARSNQLAHHLRRRGAAPGVRICLCTERSLDMLIGLLAILKAGATYVPLDPAYPRERQAFVLRDAGPWLLLTTSDLVGMLPAHEAHLVLLDTERETIDREDPTPLSISLAATSPAYVIYTSGSTGLPKGVEIPHGAVTSFLRSMRERPGFGPSDTLLAVTTLSFDIAGLELYLPLTTGGRVVIADQATVTDGTRLARAITSTGTTVLQATPATWRMLLEAGWPGDTGLKILCGGEALPRPLADALLPRCASLWNLFGPTETTIWSTVAEVHPAEGSVPLGRPIASTQVYILDPRGRPTPIGIPGEIHIGGWGVATGYLHRPALTAERFLPDPFTDEPGARMYRTGDLARFRASGDIEYLGRIDHQVKVRGYRIELGEIEVLLGRHPALSEVVVTATGSQSAGGERELTAYVVARSEPPSPRELREHLKAHLPDYMIPTSFVALPVLPRTANGKIDRRALPEGGPRAPRLVEADTGEPETQLQQSIAAIWREILNLPAVGPDSNFFDLGGHSMLVSRVRIRLEGDFGRELTMVDMYRHPTVRTLARFLERPQADAPSMAHAHERADRQREARGRRRELMKGRREHG
ncbi:Malonyl CoA-acyl carrier protein transacylase [Chondromyces apiculatus DSM 436]|uniref:Malonyl CoA-acyl carrier protein transacylase n=1 Tax=Chondromyces apiculatus DSM 436 TaxID=1192034 RepID=A0A017T956_9BACT|nr:Malonyl CoA-acyl carrier protein transacylase [Chondromyces apiculatus DSM 436]